MKKDEILVIFETANRANYFIEDTILPLMPFLKRKSIGEYSSDTYVVRGLSLANENNLRGRSPDLIYLTEECSIKQYNFVLELVNGNHDKIRVI